MINSGETFKQYHAPCKKKKKIVAQMGAETIFSNVVDRPLKLTCSRESRWVLETTLPNLLLFIFL